MTLPHGAGNKRGNRKMTELREGTKVALYARVSTDDRRAIQAQLDRMRRHAEEAGWEPVSHFTDMNRSRDEFDWMMAQATSENPPFQGIIVYARNRFSRRSADWEAWNAELEANRVRVISIKEPI